MYRSNSYEVDFSKDMMSKKARQIYLLELIKDGSMDVAEALKFTIKKMGLKEFCEISGLSKQNLNKFLNSQSLKQRTIDGLLANFGLRTELIVKKVA